MAGNPAQGTASANDGDSEAHSKTREARKSTQTAAVPPGSGKSAQRRPDAETGSNRNSSGRDASDDLLKRALAALVAGRAGGNDSHMLAVMANMKVRGESFDEFDRWAEAAGCTCTDRPIRWNNPPSSNQSPKPGWAIVNLAEKHYGFDFRKRNGHKGNRPQAVGNSRAKVGKTTNAAPPPPSWDGLTHAYQAAWLAYVAHDAPIVVWNPEAREPDGAIGYTLYAVDEHTGRLECGHLMTGYRVAAAKAYLAACLDLKDAEFAQCAKHARSMRNARTAFFLAENVGASSALYPDVWKGIPFHTPRELDADLSVISTPKGAWSIPDGRYLTAKEAQPKLCSATIRWDYDATAAHPLALEVFESLYGDLLDPTRLEFSRWRLAATALVRRPDREIIVKISRTGSAKTTEGNLQLNAFWPLVVKGERAAIERSGGYNSGGASHNSYLADFARPARRVNVAEAASEDGRRQKAFDGQMLRDLSESSTVTYRNPGPHPRVILPYDAHLFIDGNIPEQGQDLLRIAGASDGAAAIKDRLRGSPYSQIPKDQQRSEWRDYANPGRAHNDQEAEDIAELNRTIVRLMFDGMAQHWDLLTEELPRDQFSSQVVQNLENRGKARWLVEWLPQVLRPTGKCESDTHTLAIYCSYLAWHDEHGEGKPVSRRAVTEAVATRYDLQLGPHPKVDHDGKRVETKNTKGWTLAD